MEVKKYTIDFTNINYYLEMHAVIRRALEFPDYYGCNWSAFWDCLTNMYGEPMHIEIIGLDVIKSKFDGSAEKMIEILHRFKHYFDDRFSDMITIEIIDENGKVAIE